MPEAQTQVPHKFVEVQWLDANSDSAWVVPRKFPKPVPVITRGWLVAEEIDHVVVAGSYIADDGEGPIYSEIIAIPMGMVETLLEIEVPNG